MSYSVSAHRVADRGFLESPPDPASPAFDAWMSEAESRTLVFEPLGSDGTIFEYWQSPATRLGLRLLGGIYELGVRAEGDDLEELRRELDTLTRHWGATVDDLDMHEYLLDARGNVLSAIRAAVEHEGYVTIS